MTTAVDSPSAGPAGGRMQQASSVKADPGKQHGPARFWAVDLHVHTPASADAAAHLYGASTPDEIVKAALNAGLDAIAITDHNTAEWCERVAAAAQGHLLVVLPGVEISTSEGHLLAMWEEGTPAQEIEDLLVKLGIKRSEQGRLDIAAEVGFAHAAMAIEASGGVAIAAHVDKNKGALSLPVAAHMKRTLLEKSLAAVEIVDLATVSEVANRLGAEREVACVRGSDAWTTGGDHHSVAGIGNRRTWIKASRPDLCGIRHALADPVLRVRLTEPDEQTHPVIDKYADSTHYRSELAALIKGTRIRSDVIDGICSKAFPVHLVRAYMSGDAPGVSAATGIEVKYVERLFDWIADQELEEEFLNLQAIEVPDGMSVEFRKPETDQYEHIERLAHGQKCTAILVIALADGNEPLIIDQPEDALHAPWIEEHLVGRLRELRGGRQYLFATRSPGLVVSADAEMIITMTSEADSGRVEASGSLERHELNRLSLHHLEGGPKPFKRRTEKLAASM